MLFTSHVNGFYVAGRCVNIYNFVFICTSMFMQNIQIFCVSKKI